jgi:hypothetical protein
MVIYVSVLQLYNYDVVQLRDNVVFLISYPVNEVIVITRLQHTCFDFESMSRVYTI